MFNLPKLVGVVHSLDTFSMCISFVSFLIHSNKDRRNIIQKVRSNEHTKKNCTSETASSDRLYRSREKHNQIIIINFKTNIRIFCIDIIFLFALCFVFEEGSSSFCVDWCEPFFFYSLPVNFCGKNYNNKRWSLISFETKRE